MEYVRIRNWEKYQSFNKARPNWIKLHVTIQTDYRFCTMSVANRLLFILLLTLSAQLENKIPTDTQWLGKRLSLKRVDLAGLLEAGFLEPCNDGVTEVLPRVREEKRERGPANTEPKISYGEFVTLTPTQHEKLVARFGPDDATAKIEKLDNYKGSKGKSYKSDYHTILNWSAKDAKENKSAKLSDEEMLNRMYPDD